MEKFLFLNGGFDGEQELDISGDEYTKLLDLCFNYCKYFSLDLKAEDFLCVESIKAYEYYPLETYDEKCGINYEAYYVYPDGQKIPVWQRKYYLCNDDTMKFLFGFENIFNYIWIKKTSPENLIFYRNDNSVLFSSLTHEGECYIYPEETEDFQEILNNPNWQKLSQT